MTQQSRSLGSKPHLFFLSRGHDSLPIDVCYAMPLGSQEPALRELRNQESSLPFAQSLVHESLCLGLSVSLDVVYSREGFSLAGVLADPAGLLAVCWKG